MFHCSLVQVLRKGIKRGIKRREDHTLGCAAWVTGAGAAQMDTACERPAKALNCYQHQLSSGTVYLQGGGKGKHFGQAAAKGSGVAQAGQELWREGGCQPRLEEHVLPRHPGTRAKGSERRKAISFGCCQRGPGSALIPYIKTS